MLTTKLKTRLSLAVPALCVGSSVSAHPSGHVEITMSKLIEHVLSSPFHIGVIATVVIAAALCVHSVSKQNKSKAKKLK